MANILVKIFGLIYTLFKPFVRTKQVYKYRSFVWSNPLIEKIRREECLCFSCTRFNPEQRLLNCHIAQHLYETCVKYDLATPVTRCKIYNKKEEE